MGLKEKFRDKSIDELAWTLTNFTGVKAQISERKRPEEKVENSWYQRSLGVIDITDGPIVLSYVHTFSCGQISTLFEDLRF